MADHRTKLGMQQIHQLRNRHATQLDVQFVAGHTRQIQHIVDETGEALGFVVDEAVVRLALAFRRPAFAQHFAIHADGREWRFQFMTHSRDEFLLLARKRQLACAEAIHEQGATA